MKSSRSLSRSSASAFGLVIALAGVGLYACSSDNPPPAGSSGTSGGFDASTDNNVPPVEGGSDAKVGDGGSTLPLGDLPTVDEPDVPCVTTNGIKTELFGSAATALGGPAVTRLQLLGARRFAAGPSTAGFITFDAVGTTPKLFNVTLGSTQTVFSSEGTTIGGFAVSAGKVDYQRYDDQGVTSGAAVSLATGIVGGPAQAWVASGGGGSLAVYLDGTTLKAAGITAAGALAGPAFAVATGVSTPHVALTYAGDKYAIAYSYASGTSSAARFVFASTTATVGAPVDLLTGNAIEPVAITPTSTGFLAVVDAGGDDHVYTVPLDATGKVSGVARRLLGGDLPFALASHGNDVALVVLTNDVKVGNMEGPRAPQFRPLDVTGKPTGPWVCLDARIPNTLYQDMSLLAEASGGYSIVYKSPTDTTMLVRTDKLGTGAP